MIPLDGLVLIAEDDENDAFFIRRAFQKCGFLRMPHVCSDGGQAMDYLLGNEPYGDRTRYPVPKILVTDLKMPRVGGFELLKWLQDHPDFMVIPTIVLTSSKDPADVKYAYCLGANAYITKPTSPADLEQIVSSLLQFWSWCETPYVREVPSCRELALRQTQAAV